MIDRNKTYFKITNKEENHNGLQYHTGIIIDPIPFDDNPDHSCVPGGIYFTDAENLVLFYCYGINIRPIKLLPDSRVIRDNGKYRADKIEMLDRISWTEHFDKWFNPEKFNWDDSCSLAKHCHEHFDKWFDPDKFDWYYSWSLAKYCHEHFDKWFDPDKFDWTYSEYLVKYCSEYKNIWEEYI